MFTTTSTKKTAQTYKRSGKAVSKRNYKKKSSRVITPENRQFLISLGFEVLV